MGADEGYAGAPESVLWLITPFDPMSLWAYNHQRTPRQVHTFRIAPPP